MAAIPLATAVLIGTGVAATGAVAAGVAQGNAAHYQAQVARNNAVAERQNAAYAASAGAAQAEQSGLQQRAKLAALRAGTAANGIDVNTGSAADVQDSERQIGRLDTVTVSNNAALAAYGYQSKATGEQAQAGLDQTEAEWDPIAGGIKGAGIALSNPTFDSKVGSLLSGPPAVPSNYAWMQSAGSDDQPSLGGGF